MISIDDMKRRHQYRFFKDDIPDKEIIDKIIFETFELCPIKLGKWYFYIDVYGPEHYEEKKKFCLQTVCDIPDGIARQNRKSVWHVGKVGPGARLAG